MAHDPLFPYSVTEYIKDLGRWMASTKVSPERQGPLIALAIGGAASTVVDQLPDVLFRVSEIQRDIADIRRKLVEDEREPDESE